MKKIGYGEANCRLLYALGKKGWRLSAQGLLTPHATSPDGKIRLWFKMQSVHMNDVGTPLSIKNSHSLFLDARDYVLPDGTARIDGFIKHVEAIVNNETVTKIHEM